MERLKVYEKSYTCSIFVLGSGGFGTVYSGIRNSDKKSVAIKFVKKENVAAWGQFEGKKVPIEIPLLDKVRHVQSVVKLYDFYETKNSFIIIMERLNSAKDLYDFITESGALSEPLARNFFKQIVEAVQCCYAANVIHGDIKDENILVDLSTMKLKLIDFGSGGLIKPTPYTSFCGTRVYCPPEWIIFSRYNAWPSTIWTLGILLFTMVSGDIPFTTDKEICESNPNFNKNITPCCKDLIKECLRKRPTERISIENMKTHMWLLNN